MNFKLRRRHIFIYVVILSLICLSIVSLSYDEFSRNPTINERNKYEIKIYLSKDEKKFLIDNNIPAKLFIPYIKEDNFELKNYEYYNLIAKYNKKISKKEIVKKGNKLVEEKFTLNSLKEIFDEKIYSLTQLVNLATSKSPYYINSKTEFYPNKELAISNDTSYIGDYKPSNLVEIDSEYTLNKKYLLLTSESNDQLKMMCDNLRVLTDSPCGGLKVKYGFISYEDAKKKENKFPPFVKPGHNDFQLGRTISFEKSETFDKSKLYLWLLDNSYRYGFVQRYPIDKANITKISSQYGVLRYVGLTQAKKMYEQNKSIEEMKE